MKPRYRIQWEFKNKVIVGHYVKAQNIEAIKLMPSFFIDSTAPDMMCLGNYARSFNRYYS